MQPGGLLFLAFRKRVRRPREREFPARPLHEEPECLLPWRPVRWDDAAASGPRAQPPCRRDLAAWRDALNDETNTGQRAFRVLVVDDERNIRKTLAVCLESLGCAVTECGTAAAAIDSLARLPHDLAFVDLRLGKESGLDLLGSLLAERPALEVIIITAYATIDTAVDAIRRGARDYLPKPF
ncbi:MAG: response regulator, partial [Deltaproteobacteria bacterium]